MRALKHWQASWFRPARKCPVERSNILHAQCEIASRRVVGGVFRARRFRDRKYIRFARQVRQRDLARRGTMSFGNRLQYRAARA